MPSYDEFYTFLMERVADRGSVAFRSVADFARKGHDSELQYPTLAALICWGESGLLEITNIATTFPSEKNVSAALKLFAAVASGHPIAGLLPFVHHEPLLAAIQEVRERCTLQSAARAQLAELVLSLEADDLLIPLGTTFTQLSIAGPELAGEVVAALSTKWLQFGPPALLQYESLLHNHPNDERAFHHFFETCPQFLEPMAKTVWSKPDFHGVLVPDFVVPRTDDSYVIVEIETSSKSLVTRANQLSAEVSEAERQGHEYKAFIMERLGQAQQHFPYIREPDCLIVIGMESGLDAVQKKALSNANNARFRLRIVGFDWLLDRARAILANVSSGKVEVVHGYRLI